MSSTELVFAEPNPAPDAVTVRPVPGLPENATVVHHQEPEPTGPVPLLRGQISLFVLPDQSLLIVFRPQGEEEDRRKLIPGFALAAAASMAGGDVNDLLAQLAGSLA